MNIGLFDLGLYGVPVALAGVAYVLLASPFLLPKGARRIGGATKADQGEDEEDLLVGARVEGWSSAVGHTVAASGLRGLPGLYLVSVRRNERCCAPSVPSLFSIRATSCTSPVW